MYQVKLLMKCISSLLFVLIFPCLILTPICAAQESRSYVLATATPGGTFFPVGYAIAALVTHKTRHAGEKAIEITSISSPGSKRNIELLCDGTVQFAILQGYVGALARSGELNSKSVDDACISDILRSVTMLWQNVEHFVVRKDLLNSESRNIQELNKLEPNRFYLGKRGSGTEASGRYILQKLGIKHENALELEHGSYVEAASALEAEIIHGMNTPGGMPVKAVCRVFESLGNKVHLLEFQDEQIREIDSIWTKFQIPANTYSGQNEVVNTIAQPNFLAARSDVADEVVDTILRIIYENPAFLKRIHPATAIIGSRHSAIDLPFKPHPGAKKFFEDWRPASEISERERVDDSFAGCVMAVD